jgi:hypothetical protein
MLWQKFAFPINIFFSLIHGIIVAFNLKLLFADDLSKSYWLKSFLGRFLLPIS